jgi:hypothetical protein
MKRSDGQFYLIAAIVIIAIILGFVTIQNYSKRPTTKVYDLSDELGIESDQVVEYGIINSETMENLITSFTETYAQYIEGDVDNLFFIFGNFEEIKVVTYKDIVQGGISVGGTEVTVTEGQAFVQTYTPELNEEGIRVVKIEIKSEDGEELKYEFELKPGENFYYIMQKEEGDQEFFIDSS